MIPPVQVVNTDLLGNLTNEQKSDLLAIGSVRRLVEGEYIFKAGMPSEHVYVIRQGRAKVFELSPQGKEVIMWFCFPGEIFGLAEVWLGSQRDVFALACTEMEILQLPRERFRAYLIQNPEIALRLIDVLSGRLRVLSDMVLNLTSNDVSSRLTKLLSRLFQRYGKSQGDRVYLEIPLSHQEIADMIGSSRQTVTSALGKFKYRHGLRIERRKISLVAPDPNSAARYIADLVN